jgi:hypothetical protein
LYFIHINLILLLNRNERLFHDFIRQIYYTIRNLFLCVLAEIVKKSKLQNIVTKINVTFVRSGKIIVNGWVIVIIVIIIIINL